MKRLLIVMASVLMVTACTAGTSTNEALAQTTQLNNKTALAVDVTPMKVGSEISAIFGPPQDLTLLQQQQRNAQQVVTNNARLSSSLDELKDTAGHTWYVFSGSTPSGWDCSGLVVWFYEQLGVTLEHRASLQAKSGEEVDKPMVGDIVAFYYPGASNAYHVGIYIGHGKFINAPRPGQVTAVERVAENQFVLAGSKIRFIRILDQDQYFPRSGNIS